MPLELTDRFVRAYERLPKHIRTKVQKALRLLEADFRHPGLRAKRMQGTGGIYEARVDQKYRLTYQRRGDWLIVRNVGPHDDVLDNP
jgi:mRNA-degrading endonuclease RelE of RelBE toxin-antitoxin system